MEINIDFPWSIFDTVFVWTCFSVRKEEELMINIKAFTAGPPIVSERKTKHFN